jgi:protein-tyrosine kinase
MSRVHDALRKASQDKVEPVRTSRVDARLEQQQRVEQQRLEQQQRPEQQRVDARIDPRIPPRREEPVPAAPANESAVYQSSSVATATIEVDHRLVPENLEQIILSAREIPYNPLKDALVVNLLQPREAPAEEFRTLRTRLNHMQSSQPIHTLVVTSASPAEGKSFTATNLAISQAQLADKRVLLADFDFRRPTLHSTFQIPCCPGITDYLVGKAGIDEVLRRIAGTNLYLLPAGEAVPNPLELLNLRECKTLIDELRNHFDWVILDSPPLLFAADGNLLSTMCDGTVLVVRIGTTTFDSVTRAMQSLCENNVLGVVVNGARRGELYSKYSYYHDYYSPEAEATEDAGILEEAQ